MFKDKIVLVTGGAGFIGSHIIDKCLELNATQVICLDNFVGSNGDFIKHLKDEPRFHLIRGSINNYELVKYLVDRCDVIFNEAASKLVVSLKNPVADAITNVLGNLTILEAIRHSANNPRIIHASTASVYGSSDKPFNEEHKRNPSTIYGIDKLTADNYYKYYAKNYGVRATILHYCHVFGPRQDYKSEAGVINIFLGKVLKGEAPEVHMPGIQIRCFTYVGDVVNANLLAYKKEETIGQEYNVASKTRISILDLVQKIILKYGTKGMKFKIGEERMGENLRPIPDTSKIEKLGFKESVTFDDGLDITKKWVEEEIKQGR